MDDAKSLNILRGMYVGALADACLRYLKAGILNDVADAKHQEQLKAGPMTAAFLGISTIPDAFLALQDIFACANWKVEKNAGNFLAIASSCQLCAKAKQIGAGNPCGIYCLSPIQGLIMAIEPSAKFKVDSTLWKGEKCQVRVELANN